MAENPEKGFGDEDLGIPDELLQGIAPKQVMLGEVVIECPVTIEFVGAGLSADARNEVIVAVMGQLQRTIKRI